ncbi:MAG TPA: hypothetical protein DEQ38_01815 [Elusimicrobia bacterium]|nr:MAG: hypothetical protein A2089_07280 [Elusimicrobia bacterium GWD2_63_28]HCC46845.1 hypothetical protein [Elusimicrobiota bacterium]
MGRDTATNCSLAALSGLLLSACYAPLNYGWLAWIALAPLFYAVTRSSGVKSAFLLGGAAGLVFYIISLIWMAAVVHYLALVFWAVFALWLALHAGLLRGLWALAEKSGLTEAKALLWAAAAGLSWAGLEYFRSELWALECPWLGLGYSQTYNAPVFQSLSLWGVYGLSALIASANAAWALLPRRRFPWLAAAVFAAVLASSYAWGRHRLEALTPDAGRPLKAALVQAERSDINKLVRLSLAPGAAGADLLVWPECSVTFPSADSPSYISYIAKKLKPSAAEAVIGVCVNEDPARGIKRGNFTLHLGRDKQVIGLYHKMHPVQFVEAGLPKNKEPEPVATPLGKLGPQICYDLAFEDGTRAMAEKGAEILITPTLDPLEWTLLQHRQHSDMSAARAVESGLWLLRAASSGESQVIDPLGFTRAALAGGAEGTLVAQARLAPGGTFYTRYGWLLGPLALLFTLAAAGLLLFEKYNLIQSKR